MRLFFPLLLLLLCLSGKIFAQQTIKGVLTDAQSKPLQEAVVMVKNSADSSIAYSTLSDASGIFYLPAHRIAKAQFIELQLLGYQKKQVPLPVFLNDTFLLSVQLCASEQLLSGVEIAGRKQLIERKADRTIFNVENSISAASDDAFTLLKKAPGVQISNNEVGIAGKSSVSVMINDRLTRVSGAELETLLRSIAGSNVSRIEIITTPPAKYDAEGNSGIINIITKKQNKNGLNGNLTLGLQQRTELSQKLQSSFNFRQNKLNVFGNTNINNLRFVTEQRTNTDYPNQQQEQVLNQDNRPLYTWSQLGADFAANERTTFGVLLTRGTMNTKRDERIQSDFFSLPRKVRDSFSVTDAFAKDIGARTVVNLNYDWKIDTTGKKLSLNLDEFYRQGSNSRDFTIENFYDGNTASSILTGDNRTHGKLTTQISSARADMEWPSAFAKYSFGAKASSIHNISDNVFKFRSAGDYLVDTGKTNAFDYRENTQAAYFSAAKSAGKFEMQMGLRAEYTQTKGVSVGTNQTARNEYFKVFPTAYLQYTLSDKHSFNINYSRRIERPSFWNMNPFRVYSNGKSYEQGNPFLQPSFAHNFELGYDFDAMLSAKAFLQTATAVAGRVSLLDAANNAFYFTQANMGNELQYGLNIGFNRQIFNWWECNADLSLARNKFSSTFYSGKTLNYSRFSASMEWGNTFTLNRKQTFLPELDLNYEGRTLDNFDVQSARYYVDAGFKALFWKKQLVASLSVDDIFRSDIWRVTNQYNGTYQQSYFDNRCLNISLTWKFGNQSLKANRTRSATDETKRAS